jgi:hypothetical protein
MGGIVNFTNITIALFLIYLLVVVKNFYDVFNPPECGSKWDDNCLGAIEDWQKYYRVILYFKKYSLPLLEIINSSYLSVSYLRSINKVPTAKD